MDLNVNNYTPEDILVILNIEKEKDVNNNDKVISFERLQNILLNKIKEITKTSGELPNPKSDIIAFYNQCFFKLVNEYQLYKKEVEDGDDYDTNFISVKEKLLPPLPNTHVVQESDSMVAKHANHRALPTWNSHLKAGQINPLDRKSYKKILNINTRFRENYQRTKSTDFVFTLPYPVKKVVSIKLGCTEFPKTVYTFSSNLGSNNFRIGRNPMYLIDISNGSYSAEDLVDVINQNINIHSNISDISLCYDINTGKMTFNTDSNDFKLNFDYDNRNPCPPSLPNIDKNQLTLGWMLGFRDGAILKPTYPAGQYERIGNKCCPILEERDISNTYTGSTFYTGEAIFDGHGTRYFLLSVNDFQNNHNEVFISPFKGTISR